MSKKVVSDVPTAPPGPSQRSVFIGTLAGVGCSALVSVA